MRKFYFKFFSLVFLILNSPISFCKSFYTFSLPFEFSCKEFINKDLQREEFNEIILTQKFYRMPIDFLEPEVQRYINSFKSPHGLITINKALARSRPYALFINSKIQEKGLPEEIFFLPVIESEFINTARSHAGAAGIWQIMENSLTHNMVITPWRDDRRNFWKSTESALSRLEYNYKILKDWKLSLSAYNAGLGRISGILRNEGINNYWSLARRGALPGETKEYIPKFFALIYVTSRSVQNNLIIHWDKSIEWDSIEISGKELSFEEIQEKTQIPLEILEMGNSELIFKKTPKDSYSFFLKVPSFWSKNVEETLSLL